MKLFLVTKTEWDEFYVFIFDNPWIVTLDDEDSIGYLYYSYSIIGVRSITTNVETNATILSNDK